MDSEAQDIAASERNRLAELSEFSRLVRHFHSNPEKRPWPEIGMRLRTHRQPLRLEKQLPTARRRQPY